MSTCPEKDIHSIYLDGELPGVYLQKYEAHLQICESCKKQLESLKFLRAIFNADKKNMELSEKDMDDSFTRLQARMSFSKHTKSNVIEFKPKLWISAAAGAVAALALVFIPVSMNLNKGGTFSNGTATFTPVANVDIVSPTTVVAHPVDGTLTSSSIANFFSNGETFVGNNDILEAFATNLESIQTPSSQQVSYNQNGQVRNVDTAAQLASYDIFSPVPIRSRKDFSEKNSNVEFSLGSISFGFQGE